MAVTHYDIFIDEDDYTEKAWCGTPVGENYDYTNDWQWVSCKKCIKNKDKYHQEIEEINKQRAEQDGDFVDFCLKEGKYKESTL